MHPIARTRRAARVVRVGACLVGALALAGCSKGPVGVDSSFLTPEGTPSGVSRLVVYPDMPVVVTIWTDKPEQIGENLVGGTWNPASPTNPDGDIYLSSSVLKQATPNAVLGMIFDQTPASGFEILRRESGGGLRDLFDHPVTAQRKWLETGSELYEFTDAQPSGYSPPSYVGRGYVEGRIAEGSPITNEGALGAPDIAGINYTGSRLPVLDSLFTISWDPVPGAAGYWVEVYDWTPGANGIERRLTGVPSPVSPSKTIDFFLGFFPATTTSYKLDTPAPLMLAYRKSEFHLGRLYSVRISAVNDAGRMIAVTLGDTPGDAIVSGGDLPGTIEVSPRGAALVQPTK